VGLYQLAQHDYNPIPIPPKRAKLGPATCRILGSALAAGSRGVRGHPSTWRAEYSRGYGEQVSNEFGLAVGVGFDE